MADLKYRKLNITGPITVQRRDYFPNNPSKFQHLILLMGPTGTGKSRFIECLSGGEYLGLSGDSLESVTSEPTLYQVMNLYTKDRRDEYKTDVFILDCPGFCDTEVSEYRVVLMLKKWFKLEQHNFYFSISALLYFHRVSDKRVGRNLKTTLEMLRILYGPHPLDISIGVVTTMWDDHTTAKQVRAAEDRQDELRTKHLSAIFGEDVPLLKFFNDQRSALKAISETLHVGSLRMYGSNMAFSQWDTVRSGPFAKPLHDMLIDRIDVLKATLDVLDKDLNEPETKENEELVEVLLQSRKKKNDILERMENDLKDIKGLPTE